MADEARITIDFDEEPLEEVTLPKPPALTDIEGWQSWLEYGFDLLGWKPITHDYESTMQVYDDVDEEWYTQPCGCLIGMLSVHGRQRTGEDPYLSGRHTMAAVTTGRPVWEMHALEDGFMSPYGPDEDYVPRGVTPYERRRTRQMFNLGYAMRQSLIEEA